MSTSVLTKDKDGNLRIIEIDNNPKISINVGQSISDFEIIQILGKGCFGEVSLVVSKKTKKGYAMKKMKVNNNSKDEDIKREIKLLQTLNHKYVVKYFTSFCENGFWHIIIQYINGKNFQVIADKNVENEINLEEKKIWKYLIQCLNGLLYLHNEKHIIHRDIKPDNIILDEADNIKISDFGISSLEGISIEETLINSKNKVLGPINFLAPEIIIGQKHSYLSDIYMLGLTFFNLASNKYYLRRYFEGKKIKTNYTDQVIPSIYSDELKNFIMSLLQEKDKRPNSEDALNEALKIYTFKYCKKVTSIMSTFCCFNSMKNIVDNFNKEDIDKYINNNNIDINNIYTKYFADAIKCLNSIDIKFESLEEICLNLRYLFNKQNKDINDSYEMTVKDFISFLIPKMNEELRENKNDNSSKNNGIIDESDLQLVIKNIPKKWNEIQSLISNEFYFINKKVYECLYCNKIIKYKMNFDFICTLKPDRTVAYLNKKSLNINDLLEHYIKKRQYKGYNLFCKNCNNYNNIVNITKTLYTFPSKFIIELNYEQNNFDLKIEETIDIKNYIERNDDISNYKLIGAIFKETKDNYEVYTSITKNKDEKWIYFNGNDFQNSSFDELKSHKNLQYLFYSNSELFDSVIE